MANDRLTIAAARPGMRVVCVDSAGARGLGLWEGRAYTIEAVASGRVRLVDNVRLFYPDRFIPASDPPPLAALLAERAPEFLAAVLDRFNRCASKLVPPDYAQGYREAIEHVREEVERAGLIAQEPRTTEREATIREGWWA